MKLILANKRNTLIILSSIITIFMIYMIYNQYRQGMGVVIQTSLKISEGAERIAIFFKILVACSIVSMGSILFSNFVKIISLIISLFPLIVLIGCSFLISGSLTTLGFPWLYFIPIIYIVVIIVYDLYVQWVCSSKFQLQIKFNKFLNIFSLIALIACVFVVVKSNEVYQAITIFGKQETLIFNFIILMVTNYLLLGFSFLVLIINNKIGALLSISPICLHQVYYYLLNYQFSSFEDLPWEFVLSPLLVILYILIKFKKSKSKTSTIENTMKERV